MPLTGSLILVVGPSGVGKDTLLDGARERLAGHEFYRFCRRVITRDKDAGGEDYIAVSEETFSQMLARKEFFHHWGAHGLRYGLPANILDDLKRGVNVIVNASRRELGHMAALWAETVVVSIEASPEIIALRLSARARESAEEIERRIRRSAELPELPCPIIRVRNETSPEAGIRALVAAIVGATKQTFFGRLGTLRTKNGDLCVISAQHPAAEVLRAGGSRVELLSSSGKTVVGELAFETGPALAGDQCSLDARLMQTLDIEDGGRLEMKPSPSPASREVLRRKIRGEELSPQDVEQVVDDMVRGRYSHAELAGFLVSAANGLTTSEVSALARSRARRTEIVRWDAPVVVDKHSMGGIPGNRITPIIIPIVTAAGLVMPKTSSRAITSASGTADAMEVLARVDLPPDELRRVVRTVGGCIAWNGKLTHSPVDDVMNAINQPLGLKSSQLDVSSILSKKMAAGSTHVLIDMPVGPEAKTRDQAEGRALSDLFLTVAQALGLEARVMMTDGTGPIGRGIGPALEMRDVIAVLENAPDAPVDLKEKALLYASTILDWAAPSDISGRARAEDILSSGRAAEQFYRIVDAQGRRAEAVPDAASMTAELVADRDMIMPGFGVRAISAIARMAGAPLSPTAGVDLLCIPGQRLTKGAPLFRIHSVTSAALENALRHARAALESESLFGPPRTSVVHCG